MALISMVASFEVKTMKDSLKVDKTRRVEKEEVDPVV
jgi:hypothetical protein